MGYRLLFERVGTPFLPFAGVWVVAAFEGFGIYIFRGFEIGPAIGADVAEFAVFAGLYLVFGNIPVFFKTGFFESLLQGGITNVAKAFFHAWAILDVALDVNGNFAVEARVVMLGFGKK